MMGVTIQQSSFIGEGAYCFFPTVVNKKFKKRGFLSGAVALDQSSPYLTLGLYLF